MTIRPWTAADLDFAVQCVEAEGWLGETREVFETFLAYDPAGCLIAAAGAERIGLCVATAYQRNGFIGELIVVEDMRGRGYGRALMRRALQYLETSGCENIYLDGDEEAVPLYEKLGFRKICRSRRFLGKIQGTGRGDVRKMRPRDLDPICALDRDAFGDDRGFFLRRRFARFPGLCFILERDRRILGFIMGRPGMNLLSAGPWYIRGDIENPGCLLGRLALESGDQPIRVGILETSAGAVKAVRAFETFRETEASWRMVRGPSGLLGIHPDLWAIGSAAKG